jgi:hypothetical protein
MPGAGHPLDEPVWSALTTRQVHFCSVAPLARRFPIDVGPLAAARDDSPEALAALVDLIPTGDEISLMQVAPPRAPDGIIASEGRVLQMTWER